MCPCPLPFAYSDIPVTVIVPLLIGIAGSLLAGIVSWIILEKKTRFAARKRTLIVTAIAGICIVLAVLAVMGSSCTSVAITSHGDGAAISLQGTDPSVFSVAGTSANIAGTSNEILLWVRPGQREEWYLQCKPHGVTLYNDGSWSGHGVLGNSQYKAEVGDRFSIMVTVMDHNLAEQSIISHCPYSSLEPVGDSRTGVNNLTVVSIL